MAYHYLHHMKNGETRGFTQSCTSESRGFTLIELLVVIAIIGILSSVVLASLNSARMKGRDARRIADIKQMQLALELWYDSEGNEYPDGLADLATDGQMSVILEDPNGNAYLYDNVDTAATDGGGACSVGDPGACTSYVIGIQMEGPLPTGDLDGTIQSVNCADSGSTGVYCARP